MLYVAVFPKTVVVAPEVVIVFELAPHIVAGPEILPGVASAPTVNARHALTPHPALTART